MRDAAVLKVDGIIYVLIIVTQSVCRDIVNSNVFLHMQRASVRFCSASFVIVLACASVSLLNSYLQISDMLTLRWLSSGL
jgi:hypothetical protein